MTADTISFGGNESSVSVLKIIVMYTFSLSSTFFFLLCTLCMGQLHGLCITF